MHVYVCVLSACVCVCVPTLIAIYFYRFPVNSSLQVFHESWPALGHIHQALQTTISCRLIIDQTVVS